MSHVVISKTAGRSKSPNCTPSLEDSTVAVGPSMNKIQETEGVYALGYDTSHLRRPEKINIPVVCDFRADTT